MASVDDHFYWVKLALGIGASAASMMTLGCSPSASPAVEGESADAGILPAEVEEPGVVDPVATQEQAWQKCSDDHMRFRRQGVWVHGGVKPGVDRAKWNALSRAERNDIFRIAACFKNAGLPGKSEITVVEQGNGPVIETRTVVFKP